MDSLVPLLVIALVTSAVIAAIGLVIWAARPDVRTYDVSRAEDGATKSLGGIPFYVKKARHVHSTSYLQWLVELSVEAVLVRGEGDAALREKLFSGAKIVPWPNPQVASLLEKLDAVAGSSEPLRDFDAAAREFRALDEADPRSLDGREPTLESNSVEQVVHVDYSSPHYINSRRPRSGSAESTIEIGAEGTLSKATAKAEDQTLTTLAGMLPISKLAEKRLSPATATGQAEAPTRGQTQGLAPGVRGKATRVEVTVERKPIAVRHTLSEVADPPDAFHRPPIPWPDDIGTYSGGYRREVLVPLDSEGEAEDATASAPIRQAPPTREPKDSAGDRATKLADGVSPPRSVAAIPGVRSATRSALPRAVYSPDGGKLTVVLESGHAHTGRYTLLLWDGADVVHRSDDMAFEAAQGLGPGKQGRAIDCIASVARLGDPGRYHLTAIVLQDGVQIGEAEAAGGFDGGIANERITLFMEEA